MKKAILLTLTLLLQFLSPLQGAGEPPFSFRGHYVCDELKLFLVINLHEKDIIVPGQEVLGELDGYMGSSQTSHVWAITSSETNGREAELEMINNYGSEDLTATLTAQDDSTLVYHHRGGSTLKFPVNNKWQKIPQKVIFKRKP